jgi:hypothetical protein
MELAARRHSGITGGGIIDNPIQMERLLAQLQVVLSLSARATPELAGMLKTKKVPTLVQRPPSPPSVMQATRAALCAA